MNEIWPASGRGLKAEGAKGWHLEYQAIAPREIRRTTMNRQDAFVLTHYTDITEAKQREVRRLQAEATRTVLRDIIEALRRTLARANRHSVTPLGSSISDHR
jgi:hypothetical protein